jgi:hypothetical protein
VPIVKRESEFGVMETVLPKREGKDVLSICMKNANGDWVKYKPRVSSKWNYDGSCDNCKTHVLSNYTKFCPAFGAEMSGE